MMPSRAVRLLKCAARCGGLWLLGWSILFAVDRAGSDEPRSIKHIRVEPTTIELHGANRLQRLLVTAEDVNGRLSDVTHRVLLQSNNPQVVRVDDGLVVGVS